jgi:hypothetical protein
MKKRWRVILPIIGLLLFAGGTYYDVQFNRSEVRSARYFWWSSIRLDRDPLNRHPELTPVEPCGNGNPNCVTWNPGFVWIEPGFTAKIMLISGLPAFSLGYVVVRTLSHFGVSELVTFMSAVPLLLVGWYFLLGWFFDWLSYRRRQRRQSLTHVLPPS